MVWSVKNVIHWLPFCEYSANESTPFDFTFLHAHAVIHDHFTSLILPLCQFNEELA